MKGRRKGDENEGAMATWRDIRDNRSSKMGGTARVISVQRDVASFERCASNGKTRGCSCVESSPRLQDVSKSKVLVKREGGSESERERARERERGGGGSCYSKSLGPADLENSSRSYYDKIFTERNRGGERGREFSGLQRRYLGT